MGTPDFAVSSLAALLDAGFNVVGVITAPDRPAGRGRKLTFSAVKHYALKQGLPVLQPKNLKSKDLHQELEALEANLQVVVAFRMLPEVVFSMPEYGCFNLHASLLPQYRGAAPINWAVMNGETKTGVTTFFLKKAIDTGNIILQREVPISPAQSAGELHDELMATGAQLVVDTCTAIQNNEANTYAQVTEGIELKKAPKIFREDCEIDWNNSTEHLFNFIRGLSPYPAAWTTVEDGKTFKIFETEKDICTHEFQPGRLFTDNKTFISFATQDGILQCLEIQLEGKRRMNTEDFLRGFAFTLPEDL
ncbi:MAG: methionyl-tRNA formyltransferase [Saprospiraceae bacterium]|nr:methionyl-tRNA formyltransferase [Saprospiraceae bacterium]